MKVAVIGAGIAGMGCAWALSKTHSVVLFEKNDVVGGHSRTIDVSINNEQIPVDTGFIVFNRRNYPNLTSLFEYLKVPFVKSVMSFGLSQRQGAFEYGTGSLKSFIGQWTNLFNIRFWKMFFDILKFNRFAKQVDSTGMTLQQLLDRMRMGEDFRLRYLLPMAASIWSMPAEKMLSYPAESLLRFFGNHGLLTLFDQPQWYTVQGGSKEYISRLMDDYSGEIQVGSDIRAVTRDMVNDGVVVSFSDGSWEQFDKLVFACHADQTLPLLEDADAQEKDVLKQFGFQSNRVVTHTDIDFMPKRKACWSSWTYLDSGKNQTVSLSYWMNNLQPLETETSVLVTMNPGIEPDSLKKVDNWITYHPVFDQAAIDAQESLEALQGHRSLYHCGAWTGYGFHEDGLRSGLKAAEKLGATIPWRTE